MPLAVECKTNPSRKMRKLDELKDVIKIVK
jgi:hypothetical protein